MSQAIPQTGACGGSCDDAVTTLIPGVQGDSGADGAAGENGVSAFTITTASFTQPAVSSSVTVSVANSTWMVPGQILYVQNAGYMSVNSKPTTTSVSLNNLGYTGNAAPASLIGDSQLVAPAGIKGDTGSAGTITLNSISPTQQKGDLIVDNGANAPAASDVRLAVGSNNQVLTADSTQATGLIWKTPKLTNSATLDFANLVAGASEDLTIAVVGAAVGDCVELGLPAAPTASIEFKAFVSAADVVTVRATNYTAGAIDPASATYRVRVNKL